MIRNIVTRERIATGVFFLGIYLASHNKLVAIIIMVLAPFVTYRAPSSPKAS